MEESREPIGPDTLAAVTSWPLAGPVSPCPPPESVSDGMTRATAGLHSRTPFATYDPGSRSWSAAQALLPLIAVDTGLVVSQIWPRSGCMFGGSVYELPRPTLPTGETGSGASLGVPWATPNVPSGGRVNSAEEVANSGTRADGTKRQVSLESQVRTQGWPTPVSADCRKGSRQYARGNLTLRGAIEASEWPTPRATDGEKGGPNQRGSKGDQMLPGAVQPWPTPTAQTYGSNQGGSAGRVGPVRPSLEAAARDWPTPKAQDGDGRGAQAKRGKGRRSNLIDVEANRQGAQGLKEITPGMLSPEWVAALMGWPIWLTDLTK